MASVQAYRGLVERLEAEAREAPGRYRTKVALLAALGFAVLGGAVLAAFGMSAGLVLALLAISPLLLLKLAKLVWIPVALGWLLLRALWVRLSPPEGHRLQAGEAPLLQAEVERLRAQTRAPRLAGIVIDGEFNAAASSVPRAMGLLGHRHYLVLGLPLMQSLGREQFAAVVAHEFGHFGGGDARFSGWIYRVRASWYRLLDALAAQQSGFNAPFVKFFGWYAPYFDAYSFVLARANEYRADAAASKAVGPGAVGEALVRCELGALRLQRDFWPALERSIPERAAPPPGLYRDMAASLRDPGDPAWLPQLLSRAADYEDTHPTLAQRLAALGVEPGATPAPAQSAAEALLGDLLPALEARFSEDWREGVAPVWEERHRRHAQDVARLEALERSASRTADEEIEFARLSVALRPEADALALFRAALARAPDRADAHGQLGALLLERGDAAGVGHLKEAMRLDPGCTDVALHHLELHYRRTGDDAGLDEVRARWARLDAERARSAHARGVLTLRDAFLPHGLDAAQLEALEAVLAGVGGIGAAWVARKRIDADPDGLPHFVLLLKWRGLVARESAKLQAVADALALPGSFIVVTGSGRRIVARRIRKAAGEPLRPGG